MTVQEDTVIEELPPSRLGTKEFWDQVYERDIENYRHHGDIGEIWFGEQSVDKMIQWVEDNCDPSTHGLIMDIGCGNGHLLFPLAESGFQNLVGVDYSQPAVDLAATISKEKELVVAFQQMDILDPSQRDLFMGKVHLAMDKGTFDAISLSTPETEGAVHPSDIYVESVYHMLNPKEGKLLITSCNWTEEELIKRFSKAGLFEFESRIKYPTFRFGGMVGQQVTTIILRRK